MIILSTFSWYKKNSLDASKKDLENFLSIKDDLYSYDSNTKNFTKWRKSNSEYFYQSINPIDGVYYKNNLSISPLKIIKNSRWINIKIEEGQYIFVLNDVFQKYEIIWKHFRTSQLGKWIFFINNIENDYKIYSFNSILDVKLLEWNTATINFKLFPSLIFKYNPSYNKDLRWADILRVSMIDSIYYLDFKWEKSSSILTWIKIWKDNLISISTEDIKIKLKKYNKLYKVIAKMKLSDIRWFDYITNFQDLFNNETKKDIYLKNIIIKSFLDILNNTNNQQQNYLNISSSLDELSKIGENKKNEALTLLKNYYYLAYYGKILVNSNSDVFKEDNSSANKVIRQIFKETSASDDHFALLSDIFFSYQFSEEESSVRIDQYLDNYLAWLKQRKILKDEDFLPFSFFLTQYSLANKKISENSISIVIYLIEMFNNYFLTIKDWWKWFNAIWVEFYNFSKIISWINSWLLNVYFNKESNWVYLLKDQYVDNSWTYPNAINIWDNILSNLKMLYANWRKDLINKKLIFSKNLNSISDINTLNSNYWELSKKYDSLGLIISILTDYDKYFEKLKLDKDALNAKWIVLLESFTLSLQDVSQYLSKFNWVDIWTLKILNQNTMNNDRYYDVQVNISGSDFSFKLKPEWHIITDLSISDWSSTWINNSFKAQVIYLDDKEKYYNDLFASEKDFTKQQYYDFANFFYNVFINPQDKIDDNTSTTDMPEKTNESKEISIFKQDQLIDKDFTYISRFIDTPFKSIQVSIVSWQYDIKLNNLSKTFSYWWSSFIAQINMSYDFINKNFYNIKIQSFDSDASGAPQFGGNTIEITSDKIRLQDFTRQFNNLWQYLYTLKFKYSSSVWNIKFDLNLWKVFIDSNGYDLIKQ